MSGIDVGQGINVGHGKFNKKNKCRALNKHRHQNVNSFLHPSKHCGHFFFILFIQNLPKSNEPRAFNMAEGTRKKTKINKRRVYVYSRL